MFVGAAYDVEVGKFFISYCEGAWTDMISVWSAINGGSYYNGGVWAPSAASALMMGDCWMDPEFTIELNDLLPPMMQQMLGETEIYEVMLF